MNKLIVKKPIISEKSLKEADKRKFTFIADKDAHKKDIKKTVEKMFGVNVISLTTTTLKGRSMRIGRRRTVKNLPALKKVTVLLKEGQSIAIFDGGQK